MTLPFAALGAIVVALLETSIAPELPIAGAQVDLVLTFAVVAAVLIGVEDGLVWAFLGGLMLDMLIPGRPIGATALTLLVVVGVAVLVARIPGPRRTLAVLAVFALTWVFHVVLLVAMVAVEGVVLTGVQPAVILSAAIQNSVVAVFVALAFYSLAQRFLVAERSEW